LILGFAYGSSKTASAPSIAVTQAWPGRRQLVVFQPGNEATRPAWLLTVAGVRRMCDLHVLSSKYLAEASSLRCRPDHKRPQVGFAVALLLISLLVAGTAFTRGRSGAAWLSAIAAGVLYYGVASGSTSPASRCEAG